MVVFFVLGTMNGGRSATGTYNLCSGNCDDLSRSTLKVRDPLKRLSVKFSICTAIDYKVRIHTIAFIAAIITSD